MEAIQVVAIAVVVLESTEHLASARDESPAVEVLAHVWAREELTQVGVIEGVVLRGRGKLVVVRIRQIKVQLLVRFPDLLSQL